MTDRVCSSSPPAPQIGILRRMGRFAGFMATALVASAGVSHPARLLAANPDRNQPSAQPAGPRLDAQTFIEQPGRVRLDDPPPDSDLPIAPINLATALQLASSRPIDVQLAQERVRTASAQLDQADAVWLPNISYGGDYNRHDGQIQDSSGAVITDSHSSLMFGAGSGIGTSAIFNLNDAIFGPLAARQTLSARRAEVQTATNDSMVAVTDAYFNVQQARGDLAAAMDATRRTELLVERVRKLASDLVLPLEVVRAEAELASRREAELAARERWQVAGSELTRLLRLEAGAQVEPVEPPHLQIMLIEPTRTIDELITLGLTCRPELAANQAQVQAALTLLRQEKFRPFVPSILLRGYSTPVSGTLAGGVFAGGSNGDIGNPGGRLDVDLQVLWQLDNLGFGNVARARVRESEHRVAVLELFRTQDRVAAEVSRAFSEARQAARRVKIAERQVRLARDSYEKNLIGLGQVRKAGDLIQTLIRPQEVVAAVQNLSQAYVAYYRAIADSNRAQFRLYRAMGEPAQRLGDEATHVEAAAPEVPPPPAPPASPVRENQPGRAGSELDAPGRVDGLFH